MKYAYIGAAALLFAVEAAQAFNLSGDLSTDPSVFLHTKKLTNEINGVTCRVFDFMDFKVFSGTPYMAVCNGTGETIEKIFCTARGVMYDSDYAIMGASVDDGYNKISELPNGTVAALNFKGGGSACDGAAYAVLSGGDKVKGTPNEGSMKASTKLVFKK